MRLRDMAARLVDGAAVLCDAGLARLRRARRGVSRGLATRSSGRDELAQYLLVWSRLCRLDDRGARGSHIRINVFLDRLPRSGRGLRRRW